MMFKMMSKPLVEKCRIRNQSPMADITNRVTRLSLNPSEMFLKGNRNPSAFSATPKINHAVDKFIRFFQCHHMTAIFDDDMG